MAMEAKTKIPNAIELHRRLNALKPTELPWMYEVSKCSPQEALRNLDRAFSNFWNSRKTKRRMGFPKFKSKKNGIGGFRLRLPIKAIILVSTGALVNQHAKESRRIARL